MSAQPEQNGFFSIITVTLNNLEGLKRTHASIKVQSCTAYEWIVIDGGSQDKTPEFLQTSNAQWVSEPDNGIYDAMNKGIERSKGHYLLFLNAGDELANPNVLERITKTAIHEPAFIYGDALEDGAYKPARKPNIARGMFTHHQAMLYERTALGNLRYDTNYKIAADYDLTARFLKTHSTILYCGFPLCNFETGGLSQTQATLGRHEQYKIRKKLRLAGPLQNIAITSAQKHLWTFRCLAPSLYWRLKSSGNNERGTMRSDNLQARP